MNKNQRIALICGVLFIILTILFPPWIQTFGIKEGIKSQGSEGYHFIGKPPEPTDTMFSIITMDVTRLLVQGIGIILLTGLAIFILHSPKNVKVPSSNLSKWIPKSRSAKIKED